MIKEPTTKLLRHQLASIDLSDLEDKKESENERKEYCAAIFAVFPRLERDLKKFMYEQLYFASNEAQAWEQVIFGRGTFNGMKILLEHWEAAKNEHQAKSGKEEDFDPHNPISEV